MSWPQVCSRINTPSSAPSSRRASRRMASAPCAAPADRARADDRKPTASTAAAGSPPHVRIHYVQLHIILQRQQIGLDVVKPEKPLIRAALGAMPVFTTMKHRHFLPTVLARPVVRTQHLRAADQQFPQHPILLDGQRVAKLPPVRRAKAANHLGDFQRGCSTSSHAADSHH